MKSILQKIFAKKIAAALCAAAFSLTLLPVGGIAEANVVSGIFAAKKTIKTIKKAKKVNDKIRKRNKKKEEKRQKEEEKAEKKAAKMRQKDREQTAQGSKGGTITGSKTDAKAKAKIGVRETAPFFPSDKLDALIKTAKKLIGTKYVYGGTTPKGFDCSGFLQYIFKQHGASIPRTADAQYEIGRSVAKKSALVKGDLVFFSYKKEISHCGLYLGKGKFIHASSSKGVRIDELNDGYWKPRYAGGKHVLK